MTSVSGKALHIASRVSSSSLAFKSVIAMRLQPAAANALATPAPMPSDVISSYVPRKRSDAE